MNLFLTIYRFILMLSVAVLITSGLNSCAGDNSVVESRLSINFSDNTIESKGFEVIETPELEKIDFSSGPYETIGAAKAHKDSYSITGKPDTKIGNFGSVMLWLKLDQDYYSGKNAPKLLEKILIIEEIGTISFNANDKSVNMEFRWDKEIVGVKPMRVLLPELPGDQWIHLGFSWDASQGVFNGYVNGTSVKIEETRMPTWQMPRSAKIRLQLGKLPIADVRVYDRVLSGDDYKAITGEKHLGKFDRLLGAADPGPLNTDVLKGKLIYENRFSGAAELDGWILEGPAKIDFEDSRMKMYSPNEEGHIVYWCDKDFPADFVAEWEYQLLSDNGLSIVFFSSESIYNTSIFDPQIEKRTGIYRQYIMGEINCYGISYQANTENDADRRTSNLRKNKGFYLGANGPVGIKPGSKETHKVSVVKHGNHIWMSVDGKQIIDFFDDPKRFGPVLGKGKIGFRQMKWTVARYGNFRVYEIE